MGLFSPILKNTIQQSGIKFSPHTALLGTISKCGCISSSLPPGIINSLHSMHDLLSVLSSLSVDSAAETYLEDALALMTMM